MQCTPQTQFIAVSDEAVSELRKTHTDDVRSKRQARVCLLGGACNEALGSSDAYGRRLFGVTSASGRFGAGIKSIVLVRREQLMSDPDTSKPDLEVRLVRFS